MTRGWLVESTDKEAFGSVPAAAHAITPRITVGRSTPYVRSTRWFLDDN